MIKRLAPTAVPLVPRAVYHPGLAADRAQVYADLQVGLGLAWECHGRVRHDAWGWVTYGGIWGMLLELEYDAEVERTRGA
jgi:hypothetical protein